MSGTSTIHEFLREVHVPYTVVPHQPAFTAQAAAATTHPSRNWAKVVVCVVDDEPIEAIVPDSLKVDFNRLLELAGGAAIRLAQENEVRRFGPAVFVDVSLAAEREIVFSAGTHVDAIAMRWTDFARTVRPIVGRFSALATDRVPAYRLSYRE